MKKTIRTLCLLLIILTFVFVTACADSDTDYEIGNDEVNNITINNINRKITYTVTLDVTTDDISAFKNTVTSKCNEVGGYIQDNEEIFDSGKCTSADITYRIPTEKLDEFVSSIEGQGGIENKTIKTNDITTDYVNAEAEKAALLERKNQLTMLLNDSQISSAERMNIINEISSVNTEIQKIELLISGYDLDTMYSTVTLNIDEPTSFLDVFIPIFILFILPAAIPLIILSVKSFNRKKRNQTTPYSYH